MLAKDKRQLLLDLAKHAREGRLSHVVVPVDPETGAIRVSDWLTAVALTVPFEDEETLTAP